jgi:hypothetical protein
MIHGDVRQLMNLGRMEIHAGALRNALKVFESGENRNMATFGKILADAGAEICF